MDGWSVNFKPSSYLLNVNNNKVSRKNERFHLSDISSIPGDFSVNFWIYVSDDWFENKVIDNVFLFGFDSKYFSRIYTDDAGLVWLEVYCFFSVMGAGGTEYYKNGFRVCLEFFANKWHNISVVIPDGFYVNEDYGFVYYDGVQLNRDFFKPPGSVFSLSKYSGFGFGLGLDAPVDVDSGKEITVFDSGDFVGYVFDLAIFNILLTLSAVRFIYNAGVPFTWWNYPEIKFASEHLYRMQDKKDYNKKTVLIENLVSGVEDLQFFSSRENRTNRVSKIPTSLLLTDEQKYLATTRNNNLYKSTTVPEKDFQNLWIQNCAIEKKKYYDTVGLSRSFPAGEQKSLYVFDKSLLYKEGDGAFVGSTLGGFSGDETIYLSFDEFQGTSGCLTGIMFLLVYIDSANFGEPYVVGKSACFVINFSLNHTGAGKRLVGFFDTYPNYLCGPLNDPPINPDIDDMAIYDMQHSGVNFGDTMSIRFLLPNYSGNNEQVNYKYSYVIQYSFLDTNDYIVFP